MRAFDLSLYLVLDRPSCSPRGILETARAAVAGGVTLVQLRDKEADTRARIETGRALQAVLRAASVPLIVNDDIDAALAIGADGVHVGQDDVAAGEARGRIGPGMVLGVSVETEAALCGIDPALVDYVGIGPVFATPTKADHKPPIGFHGLATLATLCPVPVVAIGGLKAEHVEDTLAAGALGLAVITAICGQPDPEQAAHELRQAIARFRGSAAKGGGVEIPP